MKQPPDKLLMRTALLLLLPSLALADRPNIVFIFSDDHAYQAISAYGDSRKLLDTPNIDRLAKEGMRFDRCVVPNSICGPSRATVLTGKYAHKNGFYNNEGRNVFDGAQQTFPKLMQAAGYQTAMIGKWHLNSDPTGFDYWNILPGQGVYYNPAMIKNGTRTQNTGYVTDIITDDSLQWLGKRDAKKPFLLMMQHKAPHREWSPPLRHLGHDKDRKYPEPDTLFDEYSGRGSAEKNQDMTIAKTMTPRDLKLVPNPNLNDQQRKEWDAYYEPRNKAFKEANLQGQDLIRWKYNRYLHDYLGCVKAVDDSVGQLLKYLDDHQLNDNTIVIYASDQGFYLGEHGWFDKRWIFEESLRTPLLVRAPGIAKPGSSTAKIVSNLDFAETMLELAGLPVPQDMQGRSFVPLLKGETPANWRKAFYYHYYEFPGSHSVAKHYGVVTEQYKLFHCYDLKEPYWELFDIKADPKEMKNVYEYEKYAAIRSELHEELKKLRKDLEVPEPDLPESKTGQGKKK
jgi:arylsulfatase A-like enzyme